MLRYVESDFSESVERRTTIGNQTMSVRLVKAGHWLLTYLGRVNY